jgi:uncharacterized protein YceK
MKKTIFLSVLVISLVVTGCATIVSGSKQKVSFNSTPAKASVLVNGVQIGYTPFETKLKRGVKAHKVKIVLEGYKPYEATLTRKFNGWYIGNIAFGGLIGMIVDLSTGAVYKISEKELNVSLENNVSMTKNKDEVYVAVVMEADKNLIKIGELEKN